LTFSIRFLPFDPFLACNAGIFVGAGSGFAHHSYVMFDRTQIKTVDGTIAKVEWNNPHVWVWAYVPKANDKTKFDLYGFESGSLISLTRRGWRKDSLKPGDKVTISYFPLRDGRLGGYFVQGKRSNGELIVGDEAAALQLPGEKAPPPAPKP
jgi:hypothetical protein